MYKYGFVTVDFTPNSHGKNKINKYTYLYLCEYEYFEYN